MTNNDTLSIAIKKIAALELKNNAEGNEDYRRGLTDSISELKTLMTDDESDRN